MSIIIPTHDDAGRVAGLAARVGAIDYPSLDIIFVDDASSDGTPGLLRSIFAGRADVQVVVLDTNQGPGGARNAGLARARGEFVWFADSDDDWSPGVVLRLVLAAIAHQAEVVVCRAVIVSARGGHRWVDGSAVERVITGRAAVEAMLDGTIHGYLWTKLFRTALMGPRAFSTLRTQEDFLATSAALARARTVVTIPDVLYAHVVRAGSLTQDDTYSIPNLVACRDAALVLVAASQPAVSKRLVRYFESWFLYAAVFRATVRGARKGGQAAEDLRWSRSGLTWWHLRDSWTYDRGFACHCVAMKLLGTSYPAVLARALSWRQSLVRPVRGLRPAR